MGSRNFAQVAPTPATMAMNAYIFGYGGHSLVTPHTALKQLWWTDERIEAKVTRAFVVAKLRGEEREFLDKPLAFGEGLTDDSYMDWILERAKRLFLILTVIGVPDQIFGIIDDSWGDDDLPLALENVKSLELWHNNDEALNRKFYDTQFVYLLRELKHGAHIDYGPKEHIPMEHVNTLPPAVSLQVWDRIHFPARPDDIFMRRKFPLTEKDSGKKCRDTFMRDVRKAKRLAHEHIATTWASYTSEDAGYVLSDFVPEHTLGTFIDHRTPTQYMRLPAAERPVLLCQWMHCLADALACLHHRNVAHTAIRPSNIWIDHDNRIAFADVGSLRTLQRGKRPNKTEAYDYAAPESQICKAPYSMASTPPPPSSMSAFGRLRKMSTSTDSGSSSALSTNGSSTRSNSVCTAGMSPSTPQSTFRSNSTTTLPSQISSPNLDPRSSNSIYNFSRHLPRSTQSGAVNPTSNDNNNFNNTKFPRPSYIDPDSLCSLPAAAPTMSDIYSLGCIFLDLLTFLIRGKNTDFVKHRTSRVPVPGGRMNKRYRTDTSFHAEPDRIDHWLDLLEGDSCRMSDPVCRGVPELVRLVRRMMCQNATLRPTARQVRDDLAGILRGECALAALCCEAREWDLGGKEGEEEEDDDANAKEAAVSPFRRTRDDLSIATGILTPELQKGTTPATAFTAAAAVVERPTGVSLGERVDMLAGAGMARGTAKGRPPSSASVATAKPVSWRKALFRLS